MENLISIIEEAEKEFDEKYLTVYKKDPYWPSGERGVTIEIKSHNRQTLLKLVEGLENEVEEFRIYYSGSNSLFEGNNQAIDYVLSLLQPLKDKLKQ